MTIFGRSVRSIHTQLVIGPCKHFNSDLHRRNEDAGVLRIGVSDQGCSRSSQLEGRDQRDGHKDIDRDCRRGGQDGWRRICE